ncbi:hypothetical protein [Paenibacillus sp. 1P07SE]|uniref:hypothetical protein n=1 Tax=Paenibacillus sp. 1P07SE TaxID=3132209 RepID=UPI0039A47D30
MLPKPAAACGCIYPENASEAFEQASAVFAGELVIAKGERKQKGMTGPIENRTVNLFEVETAWKGVEHAQVMVHTSWDSCQIVFEEGQSYLIYAVEGRDGDLYAGTCNRTPELSQAGEDLTVLGPGMTNLEQIDLRGKMRWITDKDYDLLIVGSAAMLGIMTIWLLFKRFRRNRN